MLQLPERARDVVLLVARVAVGVVFLAHGWQKFFQWGIAGTMHSFAHMGIPVPGVSAWLAALIETFGGLALVAGVALPVAGMLLALDMLGALFLYHASHGFFSTSGGYEYVLVLAVAALVLGFNGGAYALDRTLVRRREAMTR